MSKMAQVGPERLFSWMRPRRLRLIEAPQDPRRLGEMNPLQSNRSPGRYFSRACCGCTNYTRVEPAPHEVLVEQVKVEEYYRPPDAVRSRRTQQFKFDNGA
jgi:hypothetical protein